MSKSINSLNDFEDWEFEAFLNGQSVPALEAFLEKYPESRTQIEQDHGMFARFQTILHRFDCPVVDALYDYWSNDLDPTQSAQLRRHLLFCPHCQNELQMLEGLSPEKVIQVNPAQRLDEAAKRIGETVQNAIDQLRIVVATLVNPLSPQMALRGEEKVLSPTEQRDSSLQIYTGEDVTITLTTLPIELDQVHLIGQFITNTTLHEQPFRLLPKQVELPTITGKLDDLGNFEITRMPRDTYQLVIELGETSVVIPTIDLT